MYRPQIPRPSNNYYRPPNNRIHLQGFFSAPAPHHYRLPFSGNYNTFNENTESSREHWCETCDREFKTSQLLENHKQQHQKCNIDGCQFIAHPKVITKHIQMQHSSGLYKKIAKLVDPEEIKKWREERKKKYPTKDNIEKKNAQIKEKIERGEKMGMQWKKFEQKNSKPDLKKSHDNNNLKRNRPQDRFNNNKNKSQPARPPKTPKLIPEPEAKFKLKPFAGIQQLIDSEPEIESEEETNLDIVDDETDVIEEKEVINKPVLCGALNSLVNDYGSSDDEPEEAPIKTPDTKIEKVIVKEKITLLSQSSIKSTECKLEHVIENKNTVTPPESIKVMNNEDNDSGPEEVSTKKDTCEDTIVDEKSSKKPEHKMLKPKQKPKFNRNYKRKLPSTLLYKLLHKEIQQERNIILQCIRYVVSNNYFDKNTDK